MYPSYNLLDKKPMLSRITDVSINPNCDPEQQVAVDEPLAASSLLRC